MDSIKIIFGLFVMSLFVTPIVRADEDILPQKQELIKELLLVADIRNTTEKNMATAYEQLQNTTLPQMIDTALKQQYGSKSIAEIPQEKRDALINNFSMRAVEKIRKAVSEKIDVVGITEGILFNLYGKYFNEKELQTIIDFYRSPIGIKAVSLMPQISAEAMKASGEATNKVMIDVYMTTMKEEMANLFEELFPSESEDE